jgi:hypothetical protein
VKYSFDEKAQAERERTNPERRPLGGQGAGGGHPPGSGSFSRGEVEGEITPPPLSSLRITPPLIGDIVCQQAGTTVNKHWSKRTQTRTKPPINSPRWPHLTQVTIDRREGDEHSVHTNGTNPLLSGFSSSR